MGSTLTTENHRALILERFAKAWDKRKDLSLGELIAAAVDDTAIGLMTDVQLAEAVERYVLLSHAPESP